MIDSTEAAQRYGRALLVGRRVRLRAGREEDFAALEPWWQDPAQQTLQQTRVQPRPDGSDIETSRRRAANDGPGAATFSIETLDESVFVGSVGIWDATLPERDAHLAIIVGPEHTGRGYGSDAVRVMVRYGFLAMGLNRIQLEVFAFNTRARRAYARAGFVEEGVRREAAFIDGGFADEVIMAVLRREWTP